MNINLTAYKLYTLLAVVKPSKMDIKLVEKANDLLTEINELKKVDEMLKNREYGKALHLEIVQHYGGNISESKKIIISRKHNNRLLLEVTKIVKELETQLEAL